MDARAAGLLDSDPGVRFGGAVAQSHDQVMRAWEVRHEARQRIIAREVASKRDDVRVFRATYLPDGLLPPEPAVIGEWLDARVVESNAHAVALDSRWGDEPSFMTRNTLRVEVGEIFMPWDLNEWDRQGVTDDEVRRRYNTFVRFSRRVPPFLAAGELERLGGELSAEFGWTRESATRWVIVRDAAPSTGSILGLSDVRQSRGQDEHGVPWHTWAELRVPLTFPASRIARQFEQTRDLHEKLVGVAPRPTSPGNVALVLFCVERNDGKRTWMDVLKLWNEQNPDSRFDETRKGVHLFAKTVRKTYRAIMGDQLPFVWRTTEDDAG